MKIKLLRDMYIGETQHPNGAVVEVEERIGENLVRIGKAVLVTDEPTPPLTAPTKKGG